MAYVIGNTISLPEAQGNFDVISSALGQGLYSGWQNYLTQQALNRLRQQYNLVPVTVTDENGRLAIKWVYKKPAEERLQEAVKAAQKLGIPITNFGLTENGDIVTQGDLLGLADRYYARDIPAPFDLLTLALSYQFPRLLPPSEQQPQLQPQPRKHSLFQDAIRKIKSFFSTPKAKAQTGLVPTGTPVLPQKTSPSFIGQAVKLLKGKKKTKKPSSFLEVRLRWPSGEEQWVDYQIWRQYKDTDYQGVEPVEVKPKKISDNNSWYYKKYFGLE